MQPAIRAVQLSKRYSLGLTHSGSVRELVNSVAARCFKWQRKGGSAKGAECAVRPDQLWALRDLSFEVHAGEAIGIIGRNGAGKSTLLKILSRITRPTAGRVELQGHVASLLEVGTGFHPELTGRENVFLNGTILGMTKRDIRREFDSIVDFAEVEKFIDTPVKRYSSGMTVRLGFAVAAHLNPDILIVDEVLAVGDASFQKRCLGKMNDMANSGRTVLFVSHNMASIRQLTTRCLLVDGGRLAASGDPSTVIDRYLGHSLATERDPESVARLRRPDWLIDRPGSIVAADLVSGRLEENDDRLEIALGFLPHREMKSMWLGATLLSASGEAVGSAFGDPVGPLIAGRACSLCMTIDVSAIAPGRYHLRLGAHDSANQLVDLLEDVLPFEVTGNGRLPRNFGHWRQEWGAIRLETRVRQASA